MTLAVLPRPAPARVLACGAWLKNTACLLDGDQVHWSPLHGDLHDADACAALEASVEALLARAGGQVAAVAHDLHPDFHSTHVAQTLARRLGVPAVAVQHHHAHLAAVQAEHGVTAPLVGLALDGVGHGSDATPWGGELLRVDGRRWQRLGHLHPLALPGGDAAAREPWRMVAALLHALGRDDEIEARCAPVAGADAARVVHTLLQRGVRCPVTSSAGRWFDAAAGVLGWGARQAFEAQAARALEQAATRWLGEHALAVDAADAPLDALLDADGGLDLRPLLARLIELVDRGAPDAAGQGAARFHLTLADGLARWAARAAQAHGVALVALGGGCFMNALLRTRLPADLARHGPGLRALLPQAVPCGDAGLALGQAWAAALEVSSCA